MKLKELLEVVPNDYEIGLANFDKNICTISYFKKRGCYHGICSEGPYDARRN